MDQRRASEKVDDRGGAGGEPDQPFPESFPGTLPETMPGSEPGSEPEDEAAVRRAEDHALIGRAQLGEEAAFEALVDRHRARAWRVARGLVGSDEDAQDLVQEAFLRVFRSLESFDFAHGFTTWLYRIVTNLAIDHLRKRRAAISTTAHDDEDGDLDLPDEGGPQPSAGLEHDDLAREVQACLASLAPHFQSVLQLREMEGLPCTEIARIVGATHVTVRWRLHRGRKLFQEEWDRRARLKATVAGRRLAAGRGTSDGLHPAPDASEADRSAAAVNKGAAEANKRDRTDVRSPIEDQEEALE